MATVAYTQQGTRAPFRLRREWIDGWICILPVVLGTLFFSIVPIGIALYGGLTTWDGIHPPKYSGIDNFKQIFTRDLFFYVVLKNTLFFSFASIPLNIIIALGLAVLVNRPVRWVTFYRAAYYAPVVTSVVAVGIVWAFLFSSEFGLINYLLSLVGIVGPNWLGRTSSAMSAVIIVAVWQGVGHNMVILLAGLQGIPETLYEAATIDGAGRWAKFRHVTLPLLSPSIFFVSVMSFISSFQVFGIIYVMTGGGPGTATKVFVYYMWENAFLIFRMGYACALSVIMFVILGIITVLQWKLSSRWVFYT